MRNGEAISDESLMAAYRDANDAGAFELLYQRHKGGLYRYVLRQCGNAALAEELFQDVWMNVIRVRATYTAEARFATYLYRIAHNRLIDHFRRGVHRSVAKPLDDLEPDLLELVPSASHEQPENKILSNERIERFSQLLAALPEVQREAFIMQEEGGLSVAEIAAATGVNAETAKSRLRYAVAKLRRGMLELL